MVKYKRDLPKTNEYGFYEMRLESIGGLGANLSGKILGEIGALALGLNSSSFASYGSEKKGTPIKSFIRWCEADQTIGVITPVEKPHILAIFHEALAGKVAVTAGVDEDTVVIVNTDKSPDEVRDLLKLCGGTIYCVDALKIAMEEKTRINMVILGTIAKASGFIPLEATKQVVRDTIGRKYPSALEGNLKGIERGYEEIVEKHFKRSEAYPYIPYKDVEYEWGFENAPLGGVNPLFASMANNDMTASREGKVPVFHVEKCINCGLCDITCPEMALVFGEGEYKGKQQMVNEGVNYHYCKGCLRCVEICPTDALTEANEREVDVWAVHVPYKDFIQHHVEFEDMGSNSVVDAESGVTNDTITIEGEE
nr:2-oxoacid:acceptor oxidoreductase family protein [uncultured Niameybacter sp.]